MPEITDIGSPIKDFVKSFLEEAEAGLKENGFISCSEREAHVKMELNAIETREGGGKLKIHVFSLGGNKSDSSSQKMTIFAKKFDKEVEEAEKNAQIEVAKTKEARSIKQRELIG